jgi:hypothetical protein
MTVAPDQLRSALRAAPFVPFRLHLVDQRAFDVPHREFAWLLPSGRTVYVAATDADAAETIDVSLIVSLAPLGNSSRGPGLA